MKLSLPDFFAKKETQEYFLALILRDEKVTAIIFEEKNGKIHVIGKHEEYFPTYLDDMAWDDFIEVLDKTISSAEELLPDNIETQKTIFGLKEDWIEDGKIKKEHLAKLKKVSDTLGLSPIGFLILNEAITHYLAKEEGAPVSGILLDVGKNKLHISLIRGGKIIESRTTTIEGSLASTTDTVLHHFSDYEVLPSKFIISNATHHDKISHEFIKHTWSKDLPFLHVPQVKMLPPDYDARAMLVGAATQMGFEILQEVQKTSRILSAEKPITTEKPIEPEENIIPSVEETVKHDHDFGFMKDQDITSIPPPVIHHVETKHIIEDEEPKHAVPVIHENIKEKDPESIIKHSSQYFTSLEASLPVLQSGIHWLLKHVHHLTKKIPISSFQSRGKLLIILPLILGILILILLGYIFGLKANIDITVNPKTIEEKQQIILSATSPTDFSSGIVHAESVSVSEEGTVSTTATGIKETGEKAKGNITLYSRITEERTFPSGTIVEGPNELEFTFDSPVTVASVSAGASASPVTAKVNVTARQIGKESNLPSGSKFTIGSLSINTIEGKNDVAFSGGTKKETTVVARKDIDKLTSDLPKTLEQKAAEDIQKQIGEDKTLLSSFTDITLTNSDFDKKVGDETKTITLKGAVTYKTLAYSKKDIEELTKKLVEEKDSTMTLSSGNITYSVEDLKANEKEEATGTLSFKAILLPKIDMKKIQETIKGKSFEEAQAFISKLPHVTKVDITLTPGLPFLPNLLPRISNNIRVSILQ